MAYNIEELKSKYGYSQPTSAPQTGGSSEYDIEALKKKYGQTPTQPTPKINPFEAAGQGAALSVGNTIAGLAQLPVKGARAIAGATGMYTGDLDKLSSGIENIRQKAFVKPTEQSQKQTSGKAGKIVADVGQFMAGGATKVLPNIVQDAVIGASQANGDAGVGVISGAVTGVSGGLNQIPLVKNVVGKTVQRLLPGYSADVVQGLTGQRGENRTGTNAFIPGAGTAFSAGLNTAVGTAKTIQKIRNPETLIKAESKAWQVPAKEKNAKFDNAKLIQERANAKGIDLQKELVLNQDFAKTNSAKGKLDTVALQDRYRAKAADIGKIDMTPAIKEVDYAVKHEPISNIFNEAKASVKGNLTATDELAVLNYLNREEKALTRKFKNGTLKPSDIYSYKKIYSGSAGYKKGFAGDAIAEQGNTILDRVLKGKLVKIGNETGLPIDDLFKLQEKNYLIADYVKSLDGTKIPLTGLQKGRRTTLKLTGAFLGNKAGGLFGAAAGYNAANAIDEVLGNFSVPFRRSILESLRNETPEAQQKLINFLKMNESAKNGLEQRMLSGKNTIFPKIDTSGIDRQATQELTNNLNRQSQNNTLRLPAPSSNFQGRPIPLTNRTTSSVDKAESVLYKQYPKRKVLALPPPRTTVPLKPNQEYTGRYSSEDISKIKKDNGGYSSSFKNDTSPIIINNAPKNSIPKTIPQKLTKLQQQNLKTAQQLDNEALIKFGGEDGTAVRSLQEIEDLNKNLIFPSKPNGQSGKSVIMPILAATGLSAAVLSKLASANSDDKAKTSLPSASDIKLVHFNLPKIKEAFATNETQGVEEPYSLTKPSGSTVMGNDNGKYQITDEELRVYAPKYLGRKVTRDEFLSNPELQEQYMDNKITTLFKRGLSLDQIYGVHRGGASDLTPAGLKKTTTQRKDYIDKAKNTYNGKY